MQEMKVLFISIVYGYKAPRYENKGYNYVIAYRLDIPDDLSRIYKLNKNTEEMTLISEMPTLSLKYRDGQIYFVSNDNKLYSFKVEEDIVSTVSDGLCANKGKYCSLNVR
ncbi:MAG: hypothetical protein WBJ13_02430, partial [Sedimentibacter sp.]